MVVGGRSKVEGRWRKVHGGGGMWRGYVEGDVEEKVQTFGGKNEKNCQVLVSDYLIKPLF